MKKLLLILLLSSLSYMESAKILALFATPSPSHQMVFRSLTLELARRGHELVVITPSPAFKENEAPENYKEISVRNKSQEAWKKKPINSGLSGESAAKIVLGAQVEIVNALFFEYLKSDDVKRLIEDANAKFDLLILEGWFRPSIAFAYKFKIPVIRFSSFGTGFNEYENIGTGRHPILNPSIFSTKLNDNTFWREVSLLYDSFFHANLHKCNDYKNDVHLRQYFGADLPSLRELMKNVDIFLVNVHRIWEMYVPTPLSVVHVGGIHLNAEKKLPEDLKSYLDSLSNDVIYISFGTNVETSWLPAKQLNIMVEVLSSLPYQVIWKWNEDELPGRTENINISKWLPQEALLKHPKVKLFITHGGLQSTQEAIAAAVPLLGMPLNIDQFYNVETYIKLKIGLRADLKTLTKEQFRHGVNTILKDKSYHENVVALRARLHDQPQNPVQRAAWWTEHVLRYGGGHLRAPAAGMHWARYHELDLIAILVAILIITVILTAICIYYSLTFLSMYLKKFLVDIIVFK
ncbi:UDP-glycosyltransferase UGT5-like [Achroia grisella]|uniref:UDP-glycosyltransferase UGT5-like n=1 Tax=Achroia grisella TaxID=688607 RepID=UPI0027D22C60|nr:UDP-glycosyltransferase UGT5-like [Achroia grisella]